MSAAEEPVRPWDIEEVVPAKDTELGNARLLVKWHGKDLRWAESHGWLAWDGTRWKRDADGAVNRAAKDVADRLWVDVLHASDPSSAEKWAKKSQKSSTIAASIELARTERAVAVSPDLLDADPWILTAKNGTVELKTGTLREHRREDLSTRCAPVDFDPAATCPVFDAFLERVQPDPEVRAYLQRHAGYCLTGDASDQSFLVAHGSGANGKSTYFETLADALGDYAKSTPFSTVLVRRDRGEASNDLAALAGARLVIASEPPQGAKLNIAVIKQITGGDRIEARFLYREFFPFIPQFKLVLVTNHRPRIEETGEAAWRRVHLVPWAVTIPKAERDKTLRARLKAELPGILAWAARGALDYLTGGLAPPTVVQAATAQYQRDEDPVGTFLEERCIVGAAYQIRATPLLAALNEWAEINGEDTFSATALGLRLGEMGFESRKAHGHKSWLGLALRQNDGQQSDPQAEDLGTAGESGEGWRVPG